MNEVRALLLSLIRGDTVNTGDTLTPVQIQSHLERLHRMGADLPKGWETWPEVLRALERDGTVRTEGEGWLVFVPEKAKPAQTSLF